MSRKLIIPLLLAAVVPSIATAASLAESPRVKYNDADQAAARAVVLRRGDLPGGDWKGGRVKPQIGSFSCPSYRPKQADLVVTGAAAVHFTRGPSDPRDANAQVQLMRTERMVGLDWRRTASDPRIHACYRKAFTREMQAAGGKLESYGRVPFPHVAQFAREYRAVLSLRGTRWFSDAVLVGRGRFEISITMTAPIAAKSSITKLEQKLARKLVARARS